MEKLESFVKTFCCAFQIERDNRIFVHNSYTVFGDSLEVVTYTASSQGVLLFFILSISGLGMFLTPIPRVVILFSNQCCDLIYVAKCWKL